MMGETKDRDIRKNDEEKKSEETTVFDSMGIYNELMSNLDEAIKEASDTGDAAAVAMLLTAKEKSSHNFYKINLLAGVAMNTLSAISLLNIIGQVNFSNEVSGLRFFGVFLYFFQVLYTGSRFNSHLHTSRLRMIEALRVYQPYRERKIFNRARARLQLNESSTDLVVDQNQLPEDQEVHDTDLKKG